MKTEMSDVVVVEGESCAAICLSSESPFRLRAIGYRTFAWAPGRRRRRRQTDRSGSCHSVGSTRVTRHPTESTCREYHTALKRGARVLP